METRLFIHRRSGIDQTFFNRLGAQSLWIHAAAIVDQTNHHIVARLKGFQANFSGDGFTILCPHVRHFDAVVDGIADHVHQRIAHGFGERAIDFGVFAA